MARPRTPTQQKRTKGTDQRCRTNEREPTPPPGLPPIPAHLSARARTAWSHVGAILQTMGVLTQSDPIALESLCEAYADLLAARAALARPIVLRSIQDGVKHETEIAAAGETTYVTIGKSGPMIRTRPEVAQIADADRRVAMWAAKFGLSPADRSRVSANPPPATNRFAELDQHAQVTPTAQRARTPRAAHRQSTH